MNMGWKKVRLSEVVSPVARAESPMPGTIYRQIGVKLWGEGAYEREAIDGSQTKYAQLFRAKAGDIILNKIWARNGSVAVVTPALAGCFGSGEFPMFEPKPDSLESRWVHWLTKTRNFWEQCDEKSHGTSGKNRIKPEQFLKIEIPLPTLSEQRRIVARIEEFAAQINEARVLRQKAFEESKAFFNSARNKAFCESGAKYLRVRLDSVAACRLGKMLDQRFKTGVCSTPYLRNANVQWGKLELTDVYQMDFTDKERSEFMLRTGDILVCEGGDIGKAAIWNDEIPNCCYQKALHRIRCSEQVLPHYMLQHLFWAASQGHWADLKTQTTIPHLTGVKLKSYKIIVPPLSEQRRIVAELDAPQTEVDALKRLQAETATELDALLPAVLDRAFKGEL